jgi:hypothetical protein
MSAARTKTVETIEHIKDETDKSIGEALSKIREDVAKSTKMFGFWQDKFTDSFGKVHQMSGDFVTFAQGNLAAWVTSSQILADGLTSMSKQLAEASKTVAEDAMSAGKTLAAVKSPKEAIQIQSDYVSRSIRDIVAINRSVTDDAIKLHEDLTARFTDRLLLAAELFSKTGQH